MKAIILAGGSGSRLYPLTQVISKQLLPVYDKPMIYYPLSTLMLFDIKDILIISTPRDIGNIEKLFGNGSQLGLNLQYKIQPSPDGLPQAFTLGEDFIKNDDVALILGDNIFYFGGSSVTSFKEQIENNRKQNIATIFAYYVNDPERFGVIEFDKNNKVLSIEEKPKQPKSNFASVGLYFYPNDVISKTKTLKPSKRGELEITDLNNLYLKENKLSVVQVKRGNVWMDAGTPDSLIDTSNFFKIMEDRTGLKISCPEEIAYRKNFINDKQFLEIINKMKDGIKYKSYLQKIYNENK